MKSFLQTFYRRLMHLVPVQKTHAFYYHREQLRYEESMEHNRTRYLISYDKAA